MPEICECCGQPIPDRRTHEQKLRDAGEEGDLMAQGLLADMDRELQKSKPARERKAPKCIQRRNRRKGRK